MKLPIPKPRLQHFWGSALYDIPKWEWNKTNVNLFKSFTNDIAPFVSITWHQKVVLYTHIA